MKYISLRGIDGKNIGDFTVDEIKETVQPRLQKAGIWCFFDWIANW